MFALLQPFGAFPWQVYVQPGDGHWPTSEMHSVVAPSTALSRESLLLFNQLSSRHSKYMVGHTALRAWERVTQSPLPSLHGGERSSVPGLVPSDDMVNSESVVGVKPGDSGVVIGYQVDDFTHNWSAEQFVTHSHIYPGFTGKVSSLTHLPLELGCDDYSFLDQAVDDFEQGLDSILTDSIKTPELDISLDEPDAMPSLVSSGHLQLVSTISVTSKPHLAPSIRSHKLWCQARALLAPVFLATKMSASKLICCFSSHPEAFGFQSSTPADNITLIPANKKADQSIRISDLSCHYCH